MEIAVVHRTSVGGYKYGKVILPKEYIGKTVVIMTREEYEDMISELKVCREIFRRVEVALVHEIKRYAELEKTEKLKIRV